MESVSMAWSERTRRAARLAVQAGVMLVIAVGLWGGPQWVPARDLRASSGDVGAAAKPGWDSFKVIDPVVIKDGAEFKMWYSGLGLDNEARIGYATSPDGVTWTKYAGNPVLDLGPSSSWDESWVRVNAVMKQGGTYRMWYTSGGKVGYALSPDGIAWTKYGGNPVLTAGPGGSWDQSYIVHICVMFEAGTYKMWYTGVNGPDGNRGRIGYATAPDSVNWTKYPGNPVLDVGPGAWEAQWVFDPSVLKVGGAYKMWYSGVDQLPWSSTTVLRIGLATSPTGTTWIKSASNPVLSVNPSGWDVRAVTAPWVLYDGAIYHMWYRGGSLGTTTPEMIGYATSPDGVAWTKYAGNPVLRPTKAPVQVFLPTILRN